MGNFWLSARFKQVTEEREDYSASDRFYCICIWPDFSVWRGLRLKSINDLH